MRRTDVPRKFLNKKITEHRRTKLFAKVFVCVAFSKDKKKIIISRGE